MIEYTIKRLFMALVTIFLIALITFLVMNLVPGGPFDMDKSMTEETRQAQLERFNLDKPLTQQFFLYIINALKGDFGVSLKTGREISQDIFSSFGISAALGFRAIIISLTIGIFLGCMGAVTKGTFIDRLIVFFATLLNSVPSFVIASILILVFCLKLGWFPVWSATDTNYVLPVLALSLSPMSSIIKYTRTSMLDILGQEYIRTAKSQGLKEFDIIFRLALRNGAIPIITYIGPMTAYVLTGSIVIETVFTMGGLGSKFVEAITNRDYAMIMGTTLFLASIIILVNLISDLLYKLVDPRIKFE